MKNIITAVLFIVAFSVNANAQTATKETKKECCASKAACASKKTACADGEKHPASCDDKKKAPAKKA